MGDRAKRRTVFQRRRQLRAGLLEESQRQFRPLARGDVAHDHLGGRPPLEGRRQRCRFDVDDAAVKADEALLDGRRQAALALRAANALEHERPIVGVDEIEYRLANQRGWLRRAHQPRRGRVGEHHDTAAVHRDRLRRRLDQHTVALLALAERLVGTSPLAPHLDFAQLALDSRYEPAQMVPGHEILGARAHDLDRGLFAHAARDDDERDVELLLLNQRQRGRPAELRQDGVGDDQVPGFLLERGLHRLTRLDAPAHHAVPAQLELAFDQARVVGAALHQQHSQRRRHGLTCLAPTGWHTTTVAHAHINHVTLAKAAFCTVY